MMWGYGFGWLGGLLMLAFWVLVVVGVVWVFRSMGDQRDGFGSSGARRTLDERFAAGELSVEEYEERRRALR